MRVDITAYVAACEFIRLHDIALTMRDVGIEPSQSMTREMGDLRNILDLALSTREIPTRAEWNAIVRRRLTAAANKELTTT